LRATRNKAARVAAAFFAWRLLTGISLVGYIQTIRMECSPFPGRRIAMNPAQFHSTRHCTPARRKRIATANGGTEPVAPPRVTSCSKGFSRVPRSRTGMREAVFKPSSSTAVQPRDVESLSTHHDGLPMRRPERAPWQGAAGDGFFGEIPVVVPLAWRGTDVCLGRNVPGARVQSESCDGERF